MRKNCEYQGCENEATFINDSDNYVCEDCMTREVNEGDALFEDFESIESYLNASKNTRNSTLFRNI